MAFFPQPSAESPPMFESKLIDSFSRTPWFVVPMVHLPIAAASFVMGMTESGVGFLRSAALFLLGFVFWTFSEYWLHRTLFHWQPPGAFGEKMHFVLHGVHHQWPRDRYRLVFPIVPALAIGGIFWLGFTALFGANGWQLFSGFVVGYVYYDLMHYYLHHGHPKTQWIKDLRKHHLVHHSPRKGDDSKYGVSFIFWDRVFRTL